MNNGQSGSSGSPIGTVSPAMPLVSNSPDLEEMFPHIRDLIYNYIKLEHLKDGPPEIGYELMLHVVHNVAKDLAKDTYKQKTKMIQEHKSRKALTSFYTKRVKKLEADNMTLMLALDSSKPEGKDLEGKLQVPPEDYEANEHMNHLSQKFLTRKPDYNRLDADKDKDENGTQPLF